MSLIVHHLNNSRSQRILWLLEEIGAPYEVKYYDRDATTNLAPPELIAIHPLGKSPVIQDNGRVITESGAITEYLCERHCGGNLVPERGSDDYISHLEWLHFAEGSAMTPILLRLYTARIGEAAAPIEPRINQQLDAHFSYMESRVGDNGHFIGDKVLRDTALLLRGHCRREDVLIRFGGKVLPGEAAAALVLDLSPAGDLAEAAANLFGYMKQADASGAAAIAFSPIPSSGLGEAINDRLQRAAAPRG